MREILIIQRYVPVSDVYIDIATAILSENDIIYPDLFGTTNKLLQATNGINWEIYQGAQQADGWAYWKSRARALPSGFPVVVLPTNNEALPPADTVPADYEVRSRIIKQF